MSPPVIFFVLMMSVSALGEISHRDQEEHHEEFNHFRYHYEQNPVRDHHVHSLPEYHVYEHPHVLVPTYKDLTDLPNAQENLHDHREQEHYPEQPLDHHKYQPEEPYKFEGHEHKQEYDHQEPAKSYQNFNLHVGPQKVIRIPVHRHHIKHVEHLTPHTYPDHGHSVKS